jgi:hypothetical protein
MVFVLITFEDNAELRPPSSRVMPLQHVEFALVWPIFRATHIAVAHRIVQYVLPLFSIGFGPAQLPIPILALPNRNLDTLPPCSRDLISPVCDPLLQGLRGKRVWGAE